MAQTVYKSSVHFFNFMGWLLSLIRVKMAEKNTLVSAPSLVVHREIGEGKCKFNQILPTFFQSNRCITKEIC